MPCYVNLPLSWVHEQEYWLDWFIARGIAPELGLDPVALRLPRSRHEQIAARLRDAGLPCGVHLPFMGVQPVATDLAERARSLTALRLGAELARLYGAAHMIGHPYYQIPRDGTSNAEPSPAWLDISLRAWRDLPEQGEAPLFLENTYETAPEPICAVAAALVAEKGPQAVGICFDVGHWHSFAGGKKRNHLQHWLDAVVPFRVHLHLHDNDGEHDEHLGLGEGSLPFARLFDALSAQPKAAMLTATLEPHSSPAFIHSIAWMDKNPAAASLIGWTGILPTDLPLPDIERSLAAQFDPI